ncbi:hypothetical protein D3C84_954120 [compost metagenome]
MPTRSVIFCCTPAFNCFFFLCIINFTLKKAAVFYRTIIKIGPCFRITGDNFFGSIGIGNYQFCQHRLTITKKVPVFSNIATATTPPAFSKNGSQYIISFLNIGRNVIRLVQMSFIVLRESGIKIIVSNFFPI